MVEIDGSYGEGGGQILRSSLTLSLLTGKPVQIQNIRSRRKKPGLMAQHLQAVEAAAVVGSARVEGARLGGSSLTFVPQGLRPGNYRVGIGTAGSTSLVLQTVLLPLSLARAPSQLIITGGTHVAWSPCFHYLKRHWLPYLQQCGFAVGLELGKAGFYPRGGGEISVSIQPVADISSLTLKERGKLRQLHCLSIVSGLDLSIAHRQMQQVLARLEWRFPRIKKEVTHLPGPGKGTLLLLLAEFEHSRCCYYALGERGKPAERVADEAVDAFERFLVSSGAVDQHLADQLILPLVFAKGTSEVRTAEITPHLVTNIWVVAQFLPVEIDVDGELGQAGTIVIQGGGRGQVKFRAAGD
jgi:RNA 3'-terminal phosphate cyclase (ATP)